MVAGAAALGDGLGRRGGASGWLRRLSRQRFLRYSCVVRMTLAHSQVVYGSLQSLCVLIRCYLLIRILASFLLVLLLLLPRRSNVQTGSCFSQSVLALHPRVKYHCASRFFGRGRLFSCFPAHFWMVGCWPIMAVTGDRESGLDSGKGAFGKGRQQACKLSNTDTWK